jgi:hypothetical protein
VVVAKKPAWSMIGGHYVPGGEFLLPIMEELSNDGTPMPFMVLMRQKYDSELTPIAVKAKSPRTKICQRWYWENLSPFAPLPNWKNKDNHQIGVNFFNAYWASRPVGSEAADWHQCLNEPNNPETAIGTASFWMGVMDAATALHVYAAIGTWSNTWPALPGERESDGSLKEDDQFWLRADTVAMVRQCKRQGHLILTHEYTIPDPTLTPALWASGYGIGRFEKALALLPADCRDVQWAIGEWGTGVGSVIGGQAMKDCWRAGDAMLHKTAANLIGVAGWCFGPWSERGRPSSDIGYHRADALDYWKTARF